MTGTNPPASYQAFRKPRKNKIRIQLAAAPDARINFLKESIAGIERGQADLERGRTCTQAEVDQFLNKPETR